MADVGRTDDQSKRRDLQRMKARAAAFLVGAAVAFVVLRLTADGDGWAGYAEAAAEAAMVGGLADWFAVTALFRHPLRIPIPHTAIIPRRKQQLGESLGEFVETNFLDPDSIAARVAEARLAARLGTWLSRPEHARRVGDQFGGVLRGMSEVLSDDDVSGAIETAVLAKAEKVPVGPLLARALEVAVDGGHHQQALDAALAGVGRLLEDNRELLRERLARESPWWIPEAIDDRIFDKITTAVQRLIADVSNDPEHPFRKHVDQRAGELALRLATDPELGAKADALKGELLAHPEIRRWIGSLWGSLKASLLEAADDPSSPLRTRAEAGVMRFGQRLVSEPAQAAKVDRWLAGAVAYIAGQAQGEASQLISSTVARWDADETAERIELQVGRDLQFIRINGTVVGGLAGMAIHAIAQAL